MIKLTFEFDSKQAFVDFVRSLSDPLPPSQVSGAPEVVPAAEPEKAARKPRTTKPAAPAIEAPTQAPVEAATPATAPDAAAPEPAAPTSDAPVAPVIVAEANSLPASGAAAPTQGDAQRAVERVFETKGFQGAHQLLAQFGVQRLRELDASKYAEFIAHADKMVA